MKAIIVGLVLSFYCTYSFAQIEEVQLLDSMKSQACNGNKACESMFISAISMASNIARYHGECLRGGDTSKQCLNAKITYEHIASEYEQDKKSRQ
ncbi:hypothetical protein [Klebsiella pneumoniae]